MLNKAGGCTERTALMTSKKTLYPKHLLLYFKEHDLSFNTHGLHWPSIALTCLVEKTASIFNRETKNHLHEHPIYKKFCMFFEDDDIAKLCCVEHRASVHEMMPRVAFMALICTELKCINSTFKRQCTT